MEAKKDQRRAGVKKGDLPFSFEEVMRDLDKYRHRKYLDYNTLTKQQREFILKCRLPEEKVSLRKMVMLWKKIWGPIPKTSMERFVKKIIEEETHE